MSASRPIRIRDEDVRSLEAYGTLPMALRVSRRYRIVEGPGEATRLVEEAVAPVWVKDYDADAGPPSSLRERWDLSNWGVLAAFDGARRVGGALVAWRTEGIEMLRAGAHRAVLWDLRVHPDVQRRGVGTRLVAAVLAWAKQRGCTRIDVETQDVNVPACRFYARQGFELERVERDAYLERPGETKLVWSRSIR